jgi:hypothetical protein
MAAVTTERLKLDRRIHNQRVRLRWWESLFHQHVQTAMLHKPIGQRWKDFAMKLVRENRELRLQLGEKNPQSAYLRTDGSVGKARAAHSRRNAA